MNVLASTTTAAASTTINTIDCAEDDHDDPRNKYVQIVPAVVTPTSGSGAATTSAVVTPAESENNESTKDYLGNGSFFCQYETQSTRDDDDVTDGKTIRDLERELEQVKNDAQQTVEALNHLWQGVRALQIFLQTSSMIQQQENDEDGQLSSQVTLLNQISNLSHCLPGVLGDDIVGLANAVCTQTSYVELCIDEASVLTDDVQSARLAAIYAHARADRAEHVSRRLYHEKQHLIEKVGRLQTDRRLLKDEVLSLRQQIQSIQRYDTWRQLNEHLVDAVALHEHFLKTSATTAASTTRKRASSSTDDCITPDDILSTEEDTATSAVSNTEDDHRQDTATTEATKDTKDNGLLTVDTTLCLKDQDVNSTHTATTTVRSIVTPKTTATPSTTKKKRGFGLGFRRFRKFHMSTEEEEEEEETKEKNELSKIVNQNKENDENESMVHPHQLSSDSLPTDRPIDHNDDRDILQSTNDGTYRLADPTERQHSVDKEDDEEKEHLSTEVEGQTALVDFFGDNRNLRNDDDHNDDSQHVSAADCELQFAAIKPECCNPSVLRTLSIPVEESVLRK